MVHTHDIPARQPVYAEPQAQLHPAVWAGLQARGIGRLFSHQAAAVDAVLGGEHVVVATSTASGKSLCYNIPVLQVGCGAAWGLFRMLRACTCSCCVLPLEPWRTATHGLAQRPAGPLS